MKQKLVFATNNDHKAAEVRAYLGDAYEVLNLKDIGCTTDIPETGTSFNENALLKSKFVKDNFGVDCFSDDSGLEVAALNEEPGVFSARYAGGGGDAANMALLLKNMEGIADRRAQFRTVICLIQGSETYYFEGFATGTIRTAPSGSKGFGYDPVFQPEGYDCTFAEMATEQKNAISHRAKAMAKLIAFLQGQ
ncbi:non-canonical purine NTP pyrophosphatase, RdgB/HAM1 family [Pedobacter yulinensis]|uniref:dITP/XTP pyrophosphatase n=1 Tax=Pedobacter yulinensis TaxID=2126353 RepID=A0A2T3HP04_9SPHI|nr:RdgB/HAM1 family non-canonical purine NTP pyrophosphatase [Pedobacter yulinensis]PST84185.1 non-canonical purine NTP pyrophosphatase, RdgB/HAM1 family [Pedobacter yulinensis]